LGFSGRLRDLKESEVELLREIWGSAADEDLWFANLETTLLAQPREEDLFASRSTSIAALERPGPVILSVANNHVRDYDGEGLAETLKTLHSQGLAAVGAGPTGKDSRDLVVTAIRTRSSTGEPAPDLRLGWLACARTLQNQTGDGPVFWELDEEELLAAVARARPQVDLLAVSLHLGYMYIDYPHPDHRRLARALADAGADLVLGHHAHVLQGVETTAAGATLCHGLGNLLFDWTEGEVPVDLRVEEQRSGAVFLFDLDRAGVCRGAALPVRMDDDLRLRWATGEAGRNVLDRLESISSRLADGTFEKEFRRQRAQHNTGLTLKTLGRQLRQGNLAVAWDVARRVRPHHLGQAAGWLKGRLGQAVKPRREG